MFSKNKDELEAEHLLDTPVVGAAATGQGVALPGAPGHGPHRRLVGRQAQAGSGAGEALPALGAPHRQQVVVAPAGQIPTVRRPAQSANLSRISSLFERSVI